jgi:hypothetical protein
MVVQEEPEVEDLGIRLVAEVFFVEVQVILLQLVQHKALMEVLVDILDPHIILKVVEEEQLLQEQINRLDHLVVELGEQEQQVQLMQHQP